jgi:adenylosuccinate lyase
MTAVSDSRIFGNILSTAESAKIWNDESRTAHYLKFEAALAEAQAELGIVSPPYSLAGPCGLR